MRQVVLDTETTGLAVEKGHRVVEIGCVEMLERRPTGRTFQRYLNPQRPMDRGAQEVTGLSDEFLSDKALFADVAEEFVEFVRGAELIIHNASFDIGFLNGELARLEGRYPTLQSMCGVVDSLALARERYPGQRNSLDALCKRLQVESAHRTLHGALLDAQLLVEVYLNLTAGQSDLGFDALPVQPTVIRQRTDALKPSAHKVRVRFADAAELMCHDERVRVMQAAGVCLWQKAEVLPHSGEAVVA
ncbi:MAG: DNA polymerase III subunit epsilon [Pseudomarimonas sp.]